MILSIIVAMARNRVIGKGNQLPWHLPEDLKRFKKITMGHPIVMGRKTYESIGWPLPGRDNIVLTRNRGFCAEGVTAIHDLSDILDRYPNSEIFIIGGASLYLLALPQTVKLYLTLIDQDFDGDTYFPEVDFEKEFRIVEESEPMTSEKNGLPFRFVTAERR